MIKAKNMMTKDVVTISTGSSTREASKLLTSKSVSSLVVVEGSKPIAVVSERDIIQGILSKKNKVKDIMDRNFIVISPATSFYEVTRMLKENNIKRFPVVVDNDKLIGIVTETDIVGAIRDFTRLHQIIQDIILAIFGLVTAFFLFYFSPLKGIVFG